MLDNMFEKKQKKDSLSEKETRLKEKYANIENYVKLIEENMLVGFSPTQKTEIENSIESDFLIFKRLLEDLEYYIFDKYKKVVDDSIEEWRKILLSQIDFRKELVKRLQEKGRMDEKTLDNLIKTVKERIDEAEKRFGTPKNELEREIKERSVEFFDNWIRHIENMLKAKALSDNTILSSLSLDQLALLAYVGEINSVNQKKRFYWVAQRAIPVIIVILSVFINISLLPIAIVVAIIFYILVEYKFMPWLVKGFKLKLSEIFFQIIIKKTEAKFYFYNSGKILERLSLTHGDTYEMDSIKIGGDMK